MRVVVTGAAGTLGRAVLPGLRAAGHDPIGVDLAPQVGSAEWVRADLVDAAAVDRALEGADVVVHAAALHGIHIRDHEPRAFHDLNVTGTFNVWEAAVRHRIRGFVFSSTMGVYGETRRPADDGAIAILDEDLPLRPGDIYGWTKVAGEELCRYHVRQDGIPTIALRFGMFVPEPFFRFGIRLLYGGVDERDVATAVLAAVEACVRRPLGFEVYNVESPLPFSRSDGPDLRRDPLAAVERHWPGARELLRSRGVRTLAPITEVFPVEQLETGLGVRPRHDFGSWLSDLETRPGELAPGDPPWP